jgi:hypothetical protein
MFSKKNIAFIILLFNVCGTCFAQNRGSVVEIKNSEIDSLIARRLFLNQSGNNHTINNSKSLVIYGYRVQVFFGSDRKAAYNQQVNFKDLYPEFNSYITYTEPNYRVKVGDFRTRSEAEKLMSQLRPSFQTLFIFNEKINPPKIENYNVDR